MGLLARAPKTGTARPNIQGHALEYAAPMVARFLSIAMVGWFLSLTGLSAAQERPRANKPSAAVGQEHFGFGAGLGFYNPSGVVLRAGTRHVSLEASAGFTPLLLSYGGSRNPDLKLIAPLEVSPQLVFEILEFPKEIRGGLRLGYRYNAALGQGGTFGGQLGKRWGRLLLEGVWGISIYPKAGDELRGDQVPAGTSFNFPPEFSYGLTVQILYYP